MENNREEFHCHQDVFSRLRTSKSTEKVLETLKTKLTFDEQEERESHPGWKNRSMAAKCYCIEGDKMQIRLEIAQHFGDKSDFNHVMMYLPNHFPDHIRQLGNLFNLSSEFPKKAIINHKQVYQQSNCHEATFQIWGMNASKEAIQYQEWNANSAQ
jgi:hypothetical protein